jgi:thiol-disulfide isomerase/thioredoxin
MNNYPNFLNNTTKFNGGLKNNTIGNQIFNVKSLILNIWLKIFVIVLFVGILFIIGYYSYKYYIDNKSKYTPNRENGVNENMNNENQKNVQLMLFSTNWCPHCKSMKPSWETIKNKYENKLINGYLVEFIDVDCTQDSPQTSKLMDEYKVEGYPTIILVKDSQPINFDAKPTEETLNQFLNSVL